MNRSSTDDDSCTHTIACSLHKTALQPKYNCSVYTHIYTPARIKQGCLAKSVPVNVRTYLPVLYMWWTPVCLSVCVLRVTWYLRSAALKELVSDLSFSGGRLPPCVSPPEPGLVGVGGGGGGGGGGGVDECRSSCQRLSIAFTTAVERREVWEGE